MSLDHAGQSIPKSCGRWSDIMAAYRFLSNGAVDPHEIQRPHRELTREACAGRGVVLAVGDITDLDYTDHTKTSGLGRLGDGRGRGLQQHTVLAMDPEGRVLGILDQRWYTRPESPEGETRRERQNRWCEPDVWADAVETVGGSPRGCRLIHVADRGADNFTMIRACSERGEGFLIRAMHDRLVDGGPERLWGFIAAGPVLDRMDVRVSAHRTGMARDRRVARTARVALRTGTVRIPPPVHDPRHAGSTPLVVHAVYVCEEDPPEGEGIEPVDWMLLTSEVAATAEDARRLTGWYSRRWTIEEFHRVEKEGCRLEASQLDDAEDIKRLAAVTGVVAVRLLQLRDLASAALAGHEDPGALRAMVSAQWIAIVAALACIEAEKLTARQFWTAIARQGGWIGRASDPRPGWKCIWRGWYDINLMVRGAILAKAARSRRKCV